MPRSNIKPFPPTPFPPPGLVTSHEVARRLGVSHESLTAPNWKWRDKLRGRNKVVRIPGSGGRCSLYPVQMIDEIFALRAAADEIKIPQGFVDKDGACAFFGITRFVWKNWIRQGKVTCGTRLPGQRHARKIVYALTDLQRLREELFGGHKLYKDGSNVWHVPVGFIRRQEAMERFGVGEHTWRRWEQRGQVTCGQRDPGGVKLYEIAEIERLVEENGTFSPPYPDPQRSGVYRVPLSGRDIQRREALIDAADLPLIEGKSCSWSTTSDGIGFVTLTSGEQCGQPLRRVILGVTETALNVRHVNGDPLDCRRANLIVRSIKQRARNTRKMKAIKGRKPTSRFKGVYWETCTKSWRAAIGVGGKKKHLARFGDEIAAALAYDEAARLWFGADARLNFPDGVDAWLESQGFIPKERAAA